jgi:alpha-tubulin suppressor-like RCC1 family protein
MAARVRWVTMLALVLGACTPRGVADKQPDVGERAELEPTTEPTSKPDEPEPEQKLKPKPVSGITEVAAGVHHTCAKRDGRVYCWGYNHRGILGIGDNPPSFAIQPNTVVVPTPMVGLEALGEIVTLDLDYDFGCVLTASGEVHCWGANEDGQLGTGDRDPRSEPTKVEGLPAVARLAVSFGKVCATSERGKVWCWGTGELGDGSRHHAQSQPIEIAELSGAEQLADACLLRRGKVLCWGHNAGGEVGNGEGGCEYDEPPCPHSRCLPDKTCKYVDKPVAALDLAGVIELDAGGHQRYARMADGVLWQWGQTGHTMSLEPRDIYRPQPRDDLPQMVEVSAGASHACARTEAGELWCWGNDSFGQLGFAQVGRSGEEGPRAVAGLPKVQAISAGFYYTCVLAGDGEPEIWCWGDNGWGQLGDGTIDRRTEPAPVRW